MILMIKVNENEAPNTINQLEIGVLQSYAGVFILVASLKPPPIPKSIDNQVTELIIFLINDFLAL